MNDLYHRNFTRKIKEINKEGGKKWREKKIVCGQYTNAWKL
jgi:hypothetical protein